MIGAEIAKREAVEMPAMRGIAKRAEIRVVRSYDQESARCGRHPVKFLHRANDVGQMFDDMHYTNVVESVVAKRIRKAIKVADDVGTAGKVAIDANGPRVFVDTAPDVESALRHVGQIPNLPKALCVNARQTFLQCTHREISLIV